MCRMDVKVSIFGIKISIFSNNRHPTRAQTSCSMKVRKPYKHTRSRAPAPGFAAAPREGDEGLDEGPSAWQAPAGVAPRAGSGPCHWPFIRPLPRYGLMGQFEGGLYIVLFHANTLHLVCRYALWTPASNHRWPHPPSSAPLDLLLHGLMSYGADTVPCACMRDHHNIEAVPVVR